MANDMNVVALVGRLTRDSELRYTQGGMAIARFSIAVNRRKRTADNRWEDEANFFDCAMFGKSAESVNQYLERGRQVSIIGELRQNRWEQDGQSRSKVEIVVNSLQLLSSPSGQRADAQAFGQPAPRQQSDSYQQELPPIEYGGPEQFDDDQIPF
ncbi:MAG: Single-stranded DNA-binding protein [Spirochaetes bacterium ADurb.Bin315]|jgi:single-strand DNA-binding protein|nr:single-stranded DNA-binding protein [Spirochaetota bacterium]OQA43986.1 MAG: Single-stranded DNA-binding protein [Spirochaetes bacterium ADurb.Bin315]TAH57422.1 MAG: single-stranded DNA-binding protein [Sphaerochaeta sp.]HOE89479.1 single-stranded DNA-binding protein [Sphaerochaeta sp.]HOR80208.1 single-stranded DNA-binding protein [Sphaerochaeta sp.]